MKRLLLICALALAGSVVTIAACKQGEGDRCQVDDDCETGLVCNRAKNSCQTTTGGDLDASIIDAAPADAAVDSPVIDSAMDDAPAN